jgi:DNA-binding winged helix-turn-helix (wHTH) protein
MARYCFGPFELDPEERRLRREGEALPLAGKTLDTLVVLVENRGRLVDKEELLSKVWAGRVVEQANLTQAIFTVRRTLGDSPKDHRYIVTVSGHGYQFVAPVMESRTGTETVERNRHELRNEPRSSWRRYPVLPFAIAGITIGVLVVAIVLWHLWYSNRNNDVPQWHRISRFTNYPGVEKMPAFSPDGKEIAYVRAEHDPVARIRLLPIPERVALHSIASLHAQRA